MPHQPQDKVFQWPMGILTSEFELFLRMGLCVQVPTACWAYTCLGYWSFPRRMHACACLPGSGNLGGRGRRGKPSQEVDPSISTFICRGGGFILRGPQYGAQHRTPQIPKWPCLAHRFWISAGLSKWRWSASEDMSRAMFSRSYPAFICAAWPPGLDLLATAQLGDVYRCSGKNPPIGSIWSSRSKNLKISRHACRQRDGAFGWLGHWTHGCKDSICAAPFYDIEMSEFMCRTWPTNFGGDQGVRASKRAKA